MLAVVAGSACHTPGTPRIDGMAGAPANPATPWTVPASARTPPPPPGIPVAPAATAACRRFSDDRGRAASRSPTSWTSRSRQSGDSRVVGERPGRGQPVGSARGALFPTINGSLNLAGASTGSAFGGGGNGNSVVVDTSGGSTRAVAAVGGLTRAQITPAISMSYLMLDRGGRRGTIEAAKQQAIATNLAHNTAINERRAPGGVVTVQLSRGASAARRTDHRRAGGDTDTAAAEARLRVGVGTSGGRLQTRTALAQARLPARDVPGHPCRRQAATSRRRLGFPRTPTSTIVNILASDSVAKIAASVDTLINRAITKRPDLAEARATARSTRRAGSRRARRGLSVAHAELQRRTCAIACSDSRRAATTSTTRCSSDCRFRSSTALSRQYKCARRASAVPGRARPRAVDTAADRRAGIHVVLDAAHRDREHQVAAAELVASATLAAEWRARPVSRGRRHDHRSRAGAKRARHGARAKPFRHDGNGRPRSRSWRTTSARSTSRAGRICRSARPCRRFADETRALGPTSCFEWSSSRSRWWRAIAPRHRGKQPPTPVRVAAVSRIDAPLTLVASGVVEPMQTVVGHRAGERNADGRAVQRRRLRGAGSGAVPARPATA